jgi:hypothetical protein
VHSNNTAIAAVGNFTNVILQYRVLAIPRDFIRKFIFRYWFSHALKYYILKKNYFIADKKK